MSSNSQLQTKHISIITKLCSPQMEGFKLDLQTFTIEPFQYLNLVLGKLSIMEGNCIPFSLLLKGSQKTHSTYLF